ncbi:Sperm acrosome membrane-associated protein 6 [Sciurus carolinensis]|uniref:Sperm acrosome membrane-associated protein 6 n=1 Tax=Sciurus carolinensis TaxID=30640 RepID=A0AA41TBE2_SCICA|nr:Sperm acrosome membrane-associated protein 6 [Sciurus carolinensis]
MALMALLSLVSTVPSALLALLVSRASTWACLLCFTTYAERFRLCQMWTRAQGPRRVEQCQDAFTAAFEGLSNMQINYEERSRLQDAFTQMTLSLQEAAMAQGVQEVARRFLCHKCFSTLCDLPLDCPVQDVTVNRGDQAMFTCVVNFQLPPEEITYSWKFAAGVTGPPPRDETELQVAFREVLRWAPRDAEMIEPWRPTLGELLTRPEALTPVNLCMLAAVAALAAAMMTMLTWMFFRWYLSGN